MTKEDTNTLSSHNLGNTNEVTKVKIRRLLRGLQIETLGGKCLLAVSKDIVGMILREVWLLKLLILNLLH